MSRAPSLFRVITVVTRRDGMTQGFFGPMICERLRPPLWYGREGANMNEAARPAMPRRTLEIRELSKVQLASVSYFSLSSYTPTSYL